MDKTNDKEKRKRVSLLNYFGSNSSGTSLSPVQLPPKKPKPSSSRTLQVASANGWKRSSLAKYSASEWLIINADENKTLVVSMQCLACTKFNNQIMSLTLFYLRVGGWGFHNDFENTVILITCFIYTNSVYIINRFVHNEKKCLVNQESMGYYSRV